MGFTVFFPLFLFLFLGGVLKNQTLMDIGTHVSPDRTWKEGICKSSLFDLNLNAAGLLSLYILFKVTPLF